MDETLFQVPRDVIVKESVDFRKRYISTHGLSEPVALPDVTAPEFRSFLRALYPRCVPCNPGIGTRGSQKYRTPSARNELTKDEWLIVLKLSSRWFFKRLRELALARLKGLCQEPLEQIALGKEYHILDWVVAGYDHLVQHPDEGPYNDAVAEAIGYKVALALCKCREKKLWEDNPGYLLEVFREELNLLAGKEREHCLDEEDEDFPMDTEASSVEMVGMKKEVDAMKNRLEAVHGKLDSDRQKFQQKEQQAKRELAEALARLDSATEELEKTRLRAERAAEEAEAAHKEAVATLTQALVDKQAELDREKANSAKALRDAQTKERVAPTLDVPLVMGANRPNYQNGREHPSSAGVRRSWTSIHELLPTLGGSSSCRNPINHGDRASRSQRPAIPLTKCPSTSTSSQNDMAEPPAKKRKSRQPADSSF